MATIREALRNRLTQAPAVAALAGDRVTPIRSKQRSTFPNITYERIGGNESVHLGGPLGESEATFRLRCWSERSEKEAAELAAAAKAALNGFRGGQSGIYIQSIRVTDVSDQPLDPFAGDDVGLFCEAVDATINCEGA